MHYLENKKTSAYRYITDITYRLLLPDIGCRRRHFLPLQAYFEFFSPYKKFYLQDNATYSFWKGQKQRFQIGISKKNEIVVVS